MINGLPGLLQPWGIIVILAVWLLAFSATYALYRRAPSRPALHRDIAAIGLLALLTGGFFWRPLTESGIMMPAGGGDFASFYFPTYSYVATQIKSQTVPLWNPHLFSGMPLAADVQSAIFYPVNLALFLLVDVDYGALEWLLIAHYWLAATFMYLLLRDIGLRRIPGIAGGVTFAFCGFMVAHFGHLPMVPVAAWLPLVLLALRRAYITRARASWAWTLGGALALAMSLLAGHVQIFAYGLMATGILWLLLLLSDKSPARRYVAEWVAKGAVLVALALAVGAVQLLPSLELSTQSVRASVSYEEATSFPAQPISLLNLVLPTVYGDNPTTYNFGTYQTTENWGYCGVVTLALAAAGLLFRRSRLLAFFAVLCALALVIMVGDLTILSGWMFKFLPGFNKLRDTGRALFLLGFGFAGLAAFGLDALLDAFKANSPARRELFWWLAGVTGVIGIGAFGVMPGYMKEILLGQGALYGRLPGAINNLGIVLLWLGLLAGTGWAAFRGRFAPTTAVLLIAGLLVLDIFSPNSRFNPTTTDVTLGFKDFDALAFLQKATKDNRTGLPLRVNSDTNVQDRWQPSNAVLHDLYDTGGAWNPLKLERYDYLWGIAKRYPETPLYDLTGVAYEVISPTVSAHAGETKWELSYRDNTVTIYHNKNALPHAFLVHESFIESRPESIVLALRRFDHDPRHTVILESGKPVVSNSAGTAEDKANSDESVRATRYTPNAVDIDVTAKTAGWLVLTDAWYPGWQATIDGAPAEVLPADYAYRAVHLEPGAHHVSMQFKPASWLTGRAVTLVSSGAVVLAMLALLLAPVLMRRKSSRILSEARR